MILDLLCETILGEIFWSDDATGLNITNKGDISITNEIAGTFDNVVINSSEGSVVLKNITGSSKEAKISE
jgi:hypothetical protein